MYDSRFLSSAESDNLNENDGEIPNESFNIKVRLS